MDFPYNVDGDNKIDGLDYPPGDSLIYPTGDDPHCPTGVDPHRPIGDDIDYPGISYLIQEEYFDAAYPLHDVCDYSKLVMIIIILYVHVYTAELY